MKEQSTPTSAHISPTRSILLTGGLAILSIALGWLTLWVPGWIAYEAWKAKTLNGWTWGLAALIAGTFLPLLVISLACLVNAIRIERPRTVHFDNRGLRVKERGYQPWEARWDEILRVSYRGSRRTIVAECGVLHVTTHLNHYTALIEVMDANLPVHLQKPLEVPVIIEGGVQIFRYANSWSRGMLLLPILVGGQLPLGHGLYIAFGLEFRPDWKTADWILPYGVCGGLILLSVWGLWRMYAARIEVSDSGIIQVGLNGITRLRWTDVERGCVIGSDSLAWCELSGAGRRVRWWAGLPNGKLLHEEITRRLPENITIDWK